MLGIIQFTIFLIVSPVLMHFLLKACVQLQETRQMIYLHLECQRQDEENCQLWDWDLSILTYRFQSESQHDSMAAQRCANTLILINTLNTTESMIKGEWNQ